MGGASNGADMPVETALATSKHDRVEPAPTVKFGAALLKVASRCNIDCDYCYVYKHADQSWRSQPRLMADRTVRRFAERLREYVTLHGAREFSVTFHGGEPLLYGAGRLAAAARTIKEIAGPDVSVGFSL